MHLKTGLGKRMSGNSTLEYWNVLIVEKFNYPRSTDKEVQVRSATILGAVMKANKIIKNEHPGWTVKSVWRLNPEHLKGVTNE